MGGKPSAVEENVKSRDDGERVTRAAVDDGEGEPGPGHAELSGGKKLDDSWRNRTLLLKGHIGPVSCLAVLADGRLASGGYDKSIIIWNVADGAQVGEPLTGHTEEVTCLAPLADGRLASGSGSPKSAVGELASGSGSIIIWSVADGAPVAKLEGHPGPISSLAALRGERLASCGGDKIIRIWNVAEGKLPRSGAKPLTKLPGHTEMVISLAVLDRERLASCSYDSNMIIWNLAARTRVYLKGYPEFSLGQCLAKLNGGRLASWSNSTNTIRIWNVEENAAGGIDSVQAIKEMWGQRNGMCCLVTLKDGRLASGGLDGTIRIRPVRDSSTALQIAQCGTAFEFEAVAEKCHKNHALDDLIDAATHHALRETNNQGLTKREKDKEASNAMGTQAQVFDAIAKVVNDEKDLSATIDNLAPCVLELVQDDDLLPKMQSRGASNEAIEKLASTALFRVVLGAKFAAGPRIVLYLEMILFLALMFCFGRIAGLEKKILDWDKWYPNEKIVLLVFGFAILVYFSAREILQIISTRGTELAAHTYTPPGDPLYELSIKERKYVAKVSGLAWYAMAIPRYLLLFLVCLVQLPIFLFFKIRDGLASDSKNVDERPAHTLLETIIVGYRIKKRTEELCPGVPFFLVSSTAKRITHDPLTFLGLPRAWRVDYWNWIDVATFGCAWASFVRAAMPDKPLSVNLAAATALLLWIKFLEFLKDFSFKFSKFVLMFERVVKDLYIYIAFFFIILLMFATIFFLYLGARTKHDYGHLGGDVFNVSAGDGREVEHTYHFDQKTGYTNFPNTLWSLYLLAFTGDFDLDIFHKASLKIYLAMFIFIVVIVLLNVLIAIVSNSHDGITDKIAAGLFYRSRLEYITEVTSVFSLFRRCLGVEGPLLRRLPSWLSPENESEDSIKELLEKALDKYKDEDDDSDAARLAAIRESEDRAMRKFADIEKKIVKLADMEKKIDALLRAQGLLSGDTNTAAPAAPEDESSTGPLEKK